MNNNSKIGILAYPGSPLTFPTVQELKRRGFDDLHIICDGDQRHEKFLKIIAERTEGKAVFHQLTDFQQLQIPFYFVSDHNSDETLHLVRNLNLDILASCGTPRKIKLPLLQSCRYGLINCHPGKLPLYRGSSSVEWALLNGDEVAATAHFMTESYDEGPIIHTYPLDVRGLDYAEIRLQMITHQAMSLADAIEKVLVRKKAPQEYSSQGPGKTWTRIPDDKLQSLVGRRF